MMDDRLIAGIDVGTNGARCMVVDLSGDVIATSAEPIRSPAADVPDGWSEQDPEEWWRATCVACRAALREVGEAAQALAGLAVDSTSGTVVPVDHGGVPLRPALMYNDVRAVDETVMVRDAGAELTRKLGYAFQPSFALPKMLWVKRHQPDIYACTESFAHAADYVVAKLSGGAVVSDSSNALKSGYDLVDGCWPPFITEDLGIPEAMLPEVFTPGTPVAAVSPAAEEQTGLPAGTPIIAGCTDGTAAFLASGAAQPGDVNSNLGTTLVVRAISEALVRDPLGRIYCHLHPDGWWLPGGASSSGGEIVLRTFGDRAHDLERLVPACAPTDLLVYPLARTGERLPFVDADACGFMIGEPSSEAEHLAAMMEGAAYLERWVFEVLEALGAGTPERAFVTGGAARSDIWLQVRANVLSMDLRRPAVPESAFGAAILAAAPHLGGVSAATRAMVRQDAVTRPDPGVRAEYDDGYARFRAECARRGYGETSR